MTPQTTPLGTRDAQELEATTPPSEQARPGDSARPAVEALTPGPMAVRRKALFRFAISISLLTLVGHLLLGFEQPPVVPVIAVVVSYVANLLLETVDAWAHRRRPGYSGSWTELFYFLLPAHIAGLACAMLIYSSTIWPYLLAVTAAASSRYVFRVSIGGRRKHFLNPSNTGIAVTLLLVPLAGFTPPYMFLNNTDEAVDVLIPLGVLAAGTMLNGKLTRRLPLILAWIGGYLLQGLMRSLWSDDVFLAVVGSMSGVAFVLFTNYMITDPGTTPMTSRGQVVFGLTAAAVYGILIAAQVAFAIFFCLVITCALRGGVMYMTPRVRSSRKAEAAGRMT